MRHQRQEMKYLLLCLLSAIACTHACDDIAKSSLVGHWTFEKGKELKDLTGNFADIVLKGAITYNGKLLVKTGKWAVSPSYTGPSITEKTLVSWVRIRNPHIRAGSALALDKISVDEFDSIVYGERESYRWMAGSSFFRRTRDPRPGFIDLGTKLVQIAITYENMRGFAYVRLYVNGRLFGHYRQGYIASWSRGDTEVFWGPRQGNSKTGGAGSISAEIEESRIYTTVLKPQELVKLRLNK
uniref:DUF1080 domain-containing protein n=1 Tax=Amphimedon queenslandica TaxID=400682 RepID=A0A1X7UZW9_AMPQE